MRWLLRHLLSDADLRTIEADLAELYEMHRRQHGERAARAWLRRQQRVYPAHLLLERLSSAAQRRAAAFGHVGRDVAYSVRSLARTPVLAATIVLTLGVGLGATAAMMDVVRAVVLAPLPYADAGSLYWIYTDNPPYRFRFSVVDYNALRADHPAFSAVAGFQSRRVTVTTDSAAAQRVVARTVTGSYFPLLGQSPALGRLLGPEDEGRGERIVVLAHGYWRREFGGDPHVTGRTIGVDGESCTIVGVLQASDGPLERDVAMFMPANWPTPRRKGPFFTTVVARLRPDVSIDAARETLRLTNARLFPIWRSSYQDEKATWDMLDLRSRVVGETSSTLLLVLAAVGCVLLLACVNTINLLIARALGRRQELAIRNALGASRSRLVQQALVETAVLTLGAAAVGFVVALGALGLVTAYGADYVPRIGEVDASWRVIGPVALLAAISGMLIAVVPVLHGLRAPGSGALNAGRTGSEAAHPRRIRRALVAAEFALAAPLIVSAVLIASSLGRLHRVDVGIDTARILTAEIALPSARYPGEAQSRAFWQRALERLRALPGVESAAVADSRPPHEGFNHNNFDLEDRPTPAGQNQPICPWVAASPDFFATAGLRLERGRLLDTRDLGVEGTQAGLSAVVVDRAWAQRFFPGEDAVGRRLREGGCSTCPWITVVGVVSTVKFSGLDAPDDGTVYYPFVDLPSGFLIVRTAGQPAALGSAVREVVREIDPALAVAELATGDQLVASSLIGPRYLSVIVGVFAAAALILSIVGIYGVTAHFVQQHSREIGIRLALGGAPSTIRWMIVRQGIGLAMLGAAVGMAAAVPYARVLASFVFGVSPTDPLTLAAVGIALVAIAAVAAAGPARRAGRVDPARILREA